ncbi:hypothetical protein VaNZ11_004391 [Volvox africanus]|uniref:Ion transport domain-containing protein n=1 Tax=Volvox africanus TaxID=51714 RepID=A0ABQ5RWG7_9CHLO|nr:hypothetical protein VaNZ11_004391 [Volvox africanus]
MSFSDGREQLHALRLHLEGKQANGDTPAVVAARTGCAAVLTTIHSGILSARDKAVQFYKVRLDSNDRSWWLFTQQHVLRVVCLRVTVSRWFGRAVLTLVLASCLVMALDDPGCTDACKQEAVLNKVVSERCRRCEMYRQASTVLDVFFLASFTLEITIKSLAHNFVLGPGAYLKSGWNWIDFLATASGYLRYLPMGDVSGVSGVRAMRALRPLRALNAIPGLRLLVETLLEALPLLLDVIVLLAWIFFVFGIVALNLFMGKLHKRCSMMVDPGEGGSEGLPLQPPPSPGASWLNSSTLSNGGGNGSMNGTLQPQQQDDHLVWQVVLGLENTPCASGGAGLFKCPDNSTCIDINSNPDFGYTSFDNFGAAAFCIFQMLTLDGWTGTLLYPLMNAMGPYVPLPYFLLLVLFGAFFAMQLLVAILSSKFAQLSAQLPKKKKERRRRRMHTPPDTTDEEDEEDQPPGGGAPSGFNEEGEPLPRRRLKRPPLMTRIRRRCRRIWFRFRKRYLQALRRKDLSRWRALFWDVAYSSWFNKFMIAVILSNTITLGMEHDGMSPEFATGLEIANLVMTSAFLLEFVVKHLGLGLVGYWRNPWNLLDGAIVVSSAVELGLTYGPEAATPTNTQALSAFRMLRILRSLRLLARVEDLRKLLRMVLKGFVVLKDFMLLLVLFIFIFSILGLQQFGGSPYFAPSPNDVGFSSNFDTLWQSAYTVFQLLTADNWVTTSWDGMRARGTAAALYFVAWIIVGNFVLLTLFLAILITNFQGDEDPPPSEDELSGAEHNPFAPDDQSETASTLGGTLLGDVGGLKDQRNALQQRIARCTDPAAVYRLKKWLILVGYHHGMMEHEKEEITHDMDMLYAMNPCVFAPGAVPSVLDPEDLFMMEDDDGGDSDSRPPSANANVTVPAAYGAGSPVGGSLSEAAAAARAGLKRASVSLRMTLARLGGGSGAIPTSYFHSQIPLSSMAEEDGNLDTAGSWGVGLGSTDASAPANVIMGSGGIVGVGGVYRAGKRASVGGMTSAAVLGAGKSLKKLFVGGFNALGGGGGVGGVGAGVGGGGGRGGLGPGLATWGGAGTGGGGGRPNREQRLLGRNSAPLAAAADGGEGSGAGTEGEATSQATGRDAARLTENGISLWNTSGQRENGTMDRVAGPGGPSRNLSRHRSAVVRRGDTATGITGGNTPGRPTLITVKPQRPMLPENVAAAIAAMRNSAAWGDVAHRLSDTGIISTLATPQLEEAAAALARGHGKPQPGEEGGSSEDEEEEDEEEDEDRNVPSPAKRQEMFVERWRSWFDDADNAPGSGLTSSYGATRTHSIELLPSMGTPAATGDGGGGGGGGGDGGRDGRRDGGGCSGIDEGGGRTRTLRDGETCSGLEDVAAVRQGEGTREAKEAGKMTIRQQQPVMDGVVHVQQARAGPPLVDVDTDTTVAPAREGSRRRPLRHVVIPAVAAVVSVAVAPPVSEAPATPNMGFEASRHHSSRRALRRASLIRNTASRPSQSSNRSHSSIHSDEGEETGGRGGAANGGAADNGGDSVGGDKGCGEGGEGPEAFLAGMATAVTDSGKLGGLPRCNRHRRSVCLVDAFTQVTSPPDTATFNILVSTAGAAVPSPGPNSATIATTAADADAAAAATEARASGVHPQRRSVDGPVPSLLQNTRNRRAAEQEAAPPRMASWRSSPRPQRLSPVPGLQSVRAATSSQIVPAPFQLGANSLGSAYISSSTSSAGPSANLRAATQQPRPVSAAAEPEGRHVRDRGRLQAPRGRWLEATGQAGEASVANGTAKNTAAAGAVAGYAAGAINEERNIFATVRPAARAELCLAERLARPLVPVPIATSSFRLAGNGDGGLGGAGDQQGYQHNYRLEAGLVHVEDHEKQQSPQHRDNIHRAPGSVALFLGQDSLPSTSQCFLHLHPQPHPHASRTSSGLVDLGRPSSDAELAMFRLRQVTSSGGAAESSCSGLGHYPGSSGVHWQQRIQLHDHSSSGLHRSNALADGFEDEAKPRPNLLIEQQQQQQQQQGHYGHVGDTEARGDDDGVGVGMAMEPGPITWLSDSSNSGIVMGDVGEGSRSLTPGALSSGATRWQQQRRAGHDTLTALRLAPAAAAVEDFQVMELQKVSRVDTAFGRYATPDGAFGRVPELPDAAPGDPPPQVGWSIAVSPAATGVRGSTVAKKPMHASSWRQVPGRMTPPPIFSVSEESVDEGSGGEGGFVLPTTLSAPRRWEAQSERHLLRSFRSLDWGEGGAAVAPAPAAQQQQQQQPLLLPLAGRHLRELAAMQVARLDGGGGIGGAGGTGGGSQDTAADGESGPSPTLASLIAAASVAADIGSGEQSVGSHSSFAFTSVGYLDSAALAPTAIPPPYSAHLLSSSSPSRSRMRIYPPQQQPPRSGSSLRIRSSTPAPSLPLQLSAQAQEARWEMDGAIELQEPAGSTFAFPTSIHAVTAAVAVAAAATVDPRAAPAAAVSTATKLNPFGIPTATHLDRTTSRRYAAAAIVFSDSGAIPAATSGDSSITASASASGSASASPASMIPRGPHPDSLRSPVRGLSTAAMPLTAGRVRERSGCNSGGANPGIGAPMAGSGARAGLGRRLPFPPRHETPEERELHHTPPSLYALSRPQSPSLGGASAQGPKMRQLGHCGGGGGGGGGGGSAGTFSRIPLPPSAAPSKMQEDQGEGEEDEDWLPMPPLPLAMASSTASQLPSRQTAADSGCNFADPAAVMASRMGRGNDGTTLQSRLAAGGRGRPVAESTGWKPRPDSQQGVDGRDGEQVQWSKVRTGSEASSRGGESWWTPVIVAASGSETVWEPQALTAVPARLLYDYQGRRSRSRSSSSGGDGDGFSGSTSASRGHGDSDCYDRSGTAGCMDHARVIQGQYTVRSGLRRRGGNQGTFPLRSTAAAAVTESRNLYDVGGDSSVGGRGAVRHDIHVTAGDDVIGGGGGEGQSAAHLGVVELQLDEDIEGGDSPAREAKTRNGGGSVDAAGVGGPLRSVSLTGGELAGSAERQPQAKSAVQVKREAMVHRRRNEQVYLNYSSFFLLGPHHPLRMRLQFLVTCKWFEGVILVMILASCVVLALDRPRNDPSSRVAHVIHYLELALNVLFGVEMCLKLLLKGFLFHPGAYWRNPWDVLDGLIVGASLLAMVLSSVAFFRNLRLLRVLRPLRMVSRVKMMRTVLETLIRSLPAVANVVLFGGFLFGVFGILGTQLFSGRLSRCNQAILPDGSPVHDKSQCVPGTFICGPADVCLDLDAPTERQWLTPFLNFDHIGRSLLTLFIVATQDGYMDVLQQVIDAVGRNKQPRYNHAPWMGLYVIIFVFLGSFWLNLLVSVIIDYYSRLMLEEGDLLDSKEAREWMKLLQFSGRTQRDYWRKIPVPANRIRARCYAVASYPYFDNFILGVILANVVVMAMPHANSTPRFDDAMSYLNAAFTFIFIFEAAIKIAAMGPKLYIQDHWNKLDMFIILTSIPDLLSMIVPLGAGTGVITVLRIMRIGRMFKLIKNARGLRTLFNTLISSAPAMFKVGSLLFLLMFIYAVLGMNLFGAPGSPFDDYGDTNFDSFGASLIALFQVFTADGWSAVMAQAAGCDPMQFQCRTGGQALVACLFFCSFIMFATFIMLNLVIAVILDNFISNAQNEGLLKTSNFTDLMKMVIALRVFVRMLRVKIDGMRMIDELKAMTAAVTAAGGDSHGKDRDRRSRVRKKLIRLNGGSEHCPTPVTGALGSCPSLILGDGLTSRAMSVQRSSYQSVMSRLLLGGGTGTAGGGAGGDALAGEYRDSVRSRSHIAGAGGGGLGFSLGFNLGSLRRTFTRQCSSGSVARAVSLSGPLPHLTGATAVAGAAAGPRTRQQVGGPMLSGPGAHYEYEAARTVSGWSLWQGAGGDGPEGEYIGGGPTPDPADIPGEVAVGFDPGSTLTTNGEVAAAAATAAAAAASVGASGSGAVSQSDGSTLRIRNRCNDGLGAERPV